MKKIHYFAVAGILILSACTNPVRRPEPITNPIPQKSAKLLVLETNKHIGEPYHYGGMSRKGWDCSGFVRAMYRRSLDVDLPRTANDMFHSGTMVPLPDARQGDLVFFKIRHKKVIQASHVGIYLGHGEFIHVSRSKGVVISSLDDPYYKRHFLGLRRLAPELVASRR